MSLSHALRRLIALTLGLSLALSGLAVLPAQAIVPDQVRSDLPIVLDGRVLAISQVGNRVIVGGDFQQVRTRTGGPIVDQPYLFAYNIDTGEFDENFRPVIDGEVRDIENDPNGRHIYFAGKFKHVDGLNRGRIARYDTRSAELDGRFRGRANSKVESIAVLGDNLVIGGNFTQVQKQPREYLALVNRRTGKALAAFDHVFGIPSGRVFTNKVTGERVNTAGVHRVAVRPGANEVLVAHRHDSVSGQPTPGFTMFAADGTILPWRTDVYGITNCSSRGIAITDVSWSPDGEHFAVAHTGHDTGTVCDSLVNFSVAQTTPGNEVRQPVWSSRVFDSIFSVEWGNDAIYLGGHFRYMVHPNAPSPYPGKTTGPYTADPTRDASFNADLVLPGYVYVANQIGAIDPTSGKGIPTWLPTSNAKKGILTMTLSERGLLIGQDNGQVSGRVTGRSAVFDPTPNAGHISCSVALDASGNPIVRWSDIADAGEAYRIKRNGRFLKAVPAATNYTDTATAGGETASYTISYRRYNEAIKNHPCGTTTSAATATTNLAPVGAATQSSVLGGSGAPRAIDGNLVRAAITQNTTNPWFDLDLGSHADISAISLWNGGPANLENVSVFVSPSEFVSNDVNAIRNQAKVVEMKANSIDRNKRFGNPVFGRYIRVHIPTGALAIGEIEVLGTTRAPLECQAVAISNDTVRVTWPNVAAGRYAVSYNGSAVSVGTATTHDINVGLNPGTHDVEVRAFAKGARIDTATCSAVLGTPDIGCNVTLQNGRPVLEWNNVPWTSVSIARNGSYLTSATGSTTWTDTETLTGTQSYELRVRANGIKYVGACGSVTVP